MTQLADDTVLFLKDKWQIQTALHVTGGFLRSFGS